jgi:hypothetical protein
VLRAVNREDILQLRKFHTRAMLIYESSDSVTAPPRTPMASHIQNNEVGRAHPA